MFDPKCRFHHLEVSQVLGGLPAGILLLLLLSFFILSVLKFARMVPVPEVRNHRDNYASVATNGNMAKAEIHSILQMVAWGTRLSLGLYDFSAVVPSATNDVVKLAKEVNLFSLVLRQVGANLKENGGFPSFDATQVVKEILQQSQMVFREVEHIVPFKRVRQQEDESSVDGDALPPTHDWAWGENPRLKAYYLLGHLESLKLTLSVLLQCLYVAKITTWSHRQKSQLAIEAVSTERLQMQSLIIEQQMSLIRVYRLYQEYSLSKAAFPEALPNQGMELIQYDEREANPMALALYQEPSLSKVWPATTETEDLKRVKRIARPYVEQLLRRWTRLDEIEQRMIEEGSPTHPGHERGRWEQPFVESDSEDDFVYRREGPPRHSMSSAGPVLMPVNEDLSFERNTPSPKTGVPVSPAVNVRRTSAPVTAPMPRSLSAANYTPSPTNPYFPPSTSPSMPQRSRYSPGPSPLTSPRLSLSADAPPTPRDSGGSLHGEPSQQQAPPASPPGPAIPWRLKLNSATWDFHGGSITDANTAASHMGALADRSTVTEIMAAHVSREALAERGLAFQAVHKDVGDGRCTRFDTCFVVYRPLAWPDVLDLVRLTEALRRREKEWEGRRARRGGGPLYVQTQPPPLDRSISAPNGQALVGGSRHGWRSGGEGSDESLDDRRRSSSRRRSTRRNSSKGSGSGIAGVGKKMVAAGGVAAIISELAEGLSGAL